MVSWWNSYQMIKSSADIIYVIWRIPQFCASRTM